MAGERGLIRKVRLLLDRRSADKTAKDAQRALNKGTDPKKAEKNLSRIDKGFGRLRSAALKLGAAIGAAFAIRGIARFGREAIRVAAEADAIWTRLGGTLKTVGVNFEDVRGEIEQTARAMQDATTVGDEEFAQILQGLVVVSGDFAGSLHNVSLVADLAAGTQMDFVAASRLVGRAMIGDTATLKRYGIVVGENENAIEAMRRQFKGLAENEAQSLSGQLKQVNNEWSDFKQAVGDAMVEAGGGASILNTLTASLKSATEWANNNRTALQDTATAFLGIGTAITTAARAVVDFIAWTRRMDRRLDEFIARHGTGAGRRQAQQRLRAALYEDEGRNGGPGTGGTGGGGSPPPPPSPTGSTDPNKTLKDRITLLGKASDLNILNSEQIHEILRLEQDTRDELAQHNLTLERRVELMDRLSTLQGMSSGLVGQIGAPQFGLAGTSLFDPRIPPSVKASAGEDMAWLEQNWQQLESVGVSAAYGVAGAWQDAFALIGEEGANVGDFFETLGAGMAGALLGGIAEFAAGKVAQNVAWGIEKIAMGLGFAATGNFPSATVAEASAGQHFAAAGMWAALAGGAGAAQSALAGGGRGGLSGGVPTGARDIGGRIADRQASAPETHIHMYGDFDALNPRVQKVVHGAYELGRQSAGSNTRIHHHRGGRP